MTPARIIAPSIAPKDLDRMRGLRKNRPGWVYVWGVDGGDAFGVYVKIGFTVDLARRYDVIQRAVPWHLYRLASMPGNEELELSLHDKFAHHRQWGFPFAGTEWFYFRDEVLDWVEKGCPL